MSRYLIPLFLLLVLATCLRIVYADTVSVPVIVKIPPAPGPCKKCRDFILKLPSNWKSYVHGYINMIPGLCDHMFNSLEHALKYGYYWIRCSDVFSGWGFSESISLTLVAGVELIGHVYPSGTIAIAGPGDTVSILKDVGGNIVTISARLGPMTWPVKYGGNLEIVRTHNFGGSSELSPSLFTSTHSDTTFTGGEYRGKYYGEIVLDYETSGKDANELETRLTRQLSV